MFKSLKKSPEKAKEVKDFQLTFHVTRVWVYFLVTPLLLLLIQIGQQPLGSASLKT
jgi:hypothetical protein